MEGLSTTSRDRTFVRITRLARGDQQTVREVYQGLSETSRRLRFLVEMPAEPPATVLRLLAETDRVNHVAYVATAHGRPVGIGRWVRDRHDPCIAEAAFSVVDDYQGRGVGSLLLHQLMHSMLYAGIGTLVCTRDPENSRVERLLAPWGGTRTWVDGVIEHRIPLQWSASNSTSVPEARCA
ncbi:N-acetyltransferase family protein [Nocardioides sp.]|uniref:GNAT family N-acetyltransferase n=1 Tax=Nocardioides sp. TaxID=35761 RepID=UPI003567E8D1